MVNEKEAWKQKLCGAYFDPVDQGSSLVHSGCPAIQQCLSIFSSQNLLDINIINHEKSIQKSHFFFQNKPPFDSTMKCKHEWSGWHANKRSFFFIYLTSEDTKKFWKELQAKKIQLAAFTMKPSREASFQLLTIRIMFRSESDEKLWLCSVFLVRSCPKKNLFSAPGWWQLT